VAGAYVKQGALVSTQYNTVNFVRTMEEVLGLPPMNLNDALAQPMADIFNQKPSNWSFTATVPVGLYSTTLPITAPVGLLVPKPTHTGEYWARATKSMDFTSEDRMDFAEYNHILWKGLMGNRPIPPGRAARTCARTARSFWRITGDPTYIRRFVHQDQLGSKSRVPVAWGSCAHCRIPR